MATLPAEKRQPRILLVDDDKAMRIVLGTILRDFDYEVEEAGNGADAFARLREADAGIDLVITDYLMPVMDGVALTKRIKRDPATSDLPVIMLTGIEDPDQIAASIAAGVFYFLSKPPDRKLVESVLEAAMRDVDRRTSVRRELSRHQAGFRNIEVVRYRLSRPEEVEPVASLLASMTDDPGKAVQGIYELLQNGVEHGVLGFGFDEKVRLLQSGGWDLALRERAVDPAFNTGNVEATAIRGEGIRLTVKDTGKGFNWRQYVRVDPARAGLPCGRGISRARMLSFTSLQFNEAGNVAVATISTQGATQW